MKLITAIIQPEKLEDVKDALLKSDIKKMTVATVRGCGQQAGYEESYRGSVLKINLLPKVKIEIAVNESFVEATIDAICKGAHTGKIGDGKIFIRDLEEVVRIRTREKGEDAIG